MVKVSVIIPTFNRAGLLPRAVESVLAQTHAPFEVLVVDDGSTDGTDLLRSRWPAVKFIRSENRGVSHARNLGALNAAGEWLAFLDSDDEWLPRKLEIQLRLASQFQVIHGQENWYRSGIPVAQKKKHGKSGGRIFSRAAAICFIAPSTLLIRRDLFLSENGFREDYPVCEDYELWLRLSSKYEFGFIEEAVINRHGGHADQLSAKFKAMDYFRAKALAPFLTNADLTDEERRNAAAELLKKSAILLRGYEKYGHGENVLEVQGFAEAARIFLAQNQSAHSPAAFLPRSVESLT